jgi:hypothetical protein
VVREEWLQQQRSEGRKKRKEKQKATTTFQHLYTPEIVLRCVQIVVFLNSVVVISFVAGGVAGVRAAKRRKNDKKARRGASESQSAER